MSDLDFVQLTNWPILLGQMIAVKRGLRLLDTEQLEEFTLPRERASSTEIIEFERVLGESLPDEYRNFLWGGANGWDKFYFGLGIFGTPELHGGGAWGTANQLLEVYDAEGVLSDLKLDKDGVLPIGAGQGMTDLLLVVRNGRVGAGQVSWIATGEEVGRFDDFAAFMTSMIKERAADLGSGELSGIH